MTGQDSYFEEIIFSLAVIVAVLAYQNHITWLMWLFIVKAAWDLYCTHITAYRVTKNKTK
jgi:hypothetical protein